MYPDYQLGFCRHGKKDSTGTICCHRECPFCNNFPAVTPGITNDRNSKIFF